MDIKSKKYDLNGNIELKKKVKFMENSNSEFKFWFYLISTVALVVHGLVLLLKDFRSYGLPELELIKFRYATIWCYYMYAVHVLLSMYTETKQKFCTTSQIRSDKIFLYIEEIKNKLLFDAILTYCSGLGVLFWTLWFIDRELIVPSRYDHAISMWNQNFLHTLPLFTCLVEIINQPMSLAFDKLKPNFKIAFWITTFYLIVLIQTHNSTGIWVYPFLERLNRFQWLQYILTTYTYFYLIHLIVWKVMRVIKSYYT